MVALKEDNSSLADTETSSDGKKVVKQETTKKNEPFDVGADNEDALFNLLIEEIGNDGYFQKRFDFIYNFLYSILLTMPYLNIILAMTIPEHWCHVPGIESTNYTVEGWKEKWLPKTNKSGNEVYSSCQMFVENETELVPTGCKYGWDFDRQWYSETVPSEENWVCDKEIYVSNAFAAGRIGEIIGTFVFGQLGDSYGRKPLFYMSVLVLMVGRLLSVFTSAHYYFFLFSIALGSWSSITVYQSQLAISVEISAPQKSSFIAFLQCLAWVIGLCILSFLSWGLRDWKLIMLASTLPNAVCFFTYKLLPESPRWLATKGEIDKAAEVLKEIAKVNKSQIPKNTYMVLEKIKNKKETFYGLASLFINWRLAKNTFLIVTCWSISGLCYYVITLNVTNMSGNPFMNFFWQSLIELPGYILGKVLCDKVGRRWTHAGSFAVSTIFCSGVIAVQTFKLASWEIVVVTLLKLGLTTSFYIAWLRTMEIYPTCVRQTGLSFGGTVSNAVGIAGSYIVYLGLSIDVRVPYCILLASILLGAVGATFLPETRNEKLPETLEEAKVFGKSQKYWSWHSASEAKQ